LDDEALAEVHADMPRVGHGAFAAGDEDQVAGQQHGRVGDFLPSVDLVGGDAWDGHSGGPVRGLHE
jgi:hypothetical protein